MRVLVVEVAFLVVGFLFFFTFLFFRTNFLLFLLGALVPRRVFVVVVAGVTVVLVFVVLLPGSFLSWPKASRSSAACKMTIHLITHYATNNKYSNLKPERDYQYAPSHQEVMETGTMHISNNPLLLFPSPY